MAVKTFDIPDIGRVKVYKRRGVRNLKLSVDHSGLIRVTIPIWAPYSTGLSFIHKQRAWVLSHSSKARPALLMNGDRVGKSLRLNFNASSSPITRTRLVGSTINIYTREEISNPMLQKKVTTATEKALKHESYVLLKQRLDQLSKANNFYYKDLRIKRLTSRWGSCSAKKEISLSLYLIQLPWNLIDYVLIHELAHTEHMHHGHDFWTRVESILPKAKELRRELSKHKPQIYPADR